MRVRQLFPSMFITISCFAITALVLGISNLGIMFELNPSLNPSQLPLATLSGYASSAVAALDSFSLVAPITLLLFWGIVGLVSFNIFTWLLQLLKAGGYNLNVSLRYVHPYDFSQASYWRPIFLGLVARLIGITGLAITAVLLCTALLPASISFTRAAILWPHDPVVLLYAVTSAVSVWGSLLLVTVFYKLSF